MDFDFEEFLESGPKLTTIIILPLILVVYISGFVIVNAYLSKYHIRQVDLFQPTFIQAGLLFVFMNLVASVIAIAASYVLSNKLSSYPKASDISTLSLIFYLLIAIFLVVVFEFVTGHLTAFILKSTYRGGQSALFQTLSRPITVIMIMQGLSFFVVSNLIFNINKLSAIFQAVTSAVVCLLFLFVETYSLMAVADNIYDKLPIYFGGGQQQFVVLFVDVPNARYLDAIDNTFTEGTDLLIDSNMIPKEIDSSGQVPTKYLSLFGQFGSANLRSADIEHAYYVRPYTCGTCPVVKIPDSGVYGVIYLSEPDLEK